MFCTDDREPSFIVEEGHINQMVRVAVADGVSPEDAIVMATINPAVYHRLWHLGAIAPGYQADILVLDDLASFKPQLVLKRGMPPRFNKLQVPEWVRQTVHMAPVSAASFRIASGPPRIRVIKVIPGQLLTAIATAEPAIRDGEIVADPASDLVKIAVIERHHASGRIGLGFATNVGLRRGAFASTVAHDAHNMVVLGVDDADMAACACRLADIGGGIVVAEGGRVVEELPLPIAGLMSDQPLAQVYETLRSMELRLAGMGVSMAAPFMSISFLALSVIPELKITDQGLVDVARFQLVPLGLTDRLDRFNRWPAATAERKLYTCFASWSWAQRVAAGRPYASFDQLVQACESAWSALVPADWVAALKAHPRIGQAGGHAPESSRREQSGVSAATRDTMAALAEDNRRYEARFGHVFLISASGRTAGEILASLRQRFHNDPATELAIAAGELRKITVLRLERMLNE
jgi:adenine deaminase